MLGWGCDNTEVCVLSDKLILRRLRSNIQRKGSSVKKQKNFTEYFNSVPKYWASFFSK
jgi:hypothetical protein